MAKDLTNLSVTSKPRREREGPAPARETVKAVPEKPGADRKARLAEHLEEINRAHGEALRILAK